MRMPIIARCLVLLSSLFCLWSFADTTPLSLRLIAEGIYVHQGQHQLPNPQNRGEIANLGFIEGERCVAVVDTGGSPEQGYALKAAIEAMTHTPICYVINTHVHPDHIYGNLAFRQPGVRFVGHHKLVDAMAARAPFYQGMAARDLGFSLRPEHFIPPDLPVTDTLTLDLGGRSLVLTAQPTAHTDNDLTVLDTKTRTLWLSDLLFMEHLPVVDGSLNGWLKVLERLATQSADRVVPGHGPVVADWPAALEAELRYLRQLQAEVRTALAANKTLEQALNETRASHYDHWELFDDFHKRNLSTAFAELEWE